MTVLSFENVDVAYGRTQILWDISFDVEAEEVISLIGRNGVGKTTLMKTAIGLLSPTNGSITFDGIDVTEVDADRRARQGIGYVPQNRDIFPGLTVEENLRVGESVNASEPEPRYDDVYRYFPRLEERKDQKAGTMSGGEQQMLAIGRALVGNPKLLLLDEPSEGIQPTIVQQIVENIRRINDELGTTMVIVEQNIEFTVQSSNRCYVIEKGEIVTELPVDELRDSEVVQEYLAI